MRSVSAHGYISNVIHSDNVKEKLDYLELLEFKRDVITEKFNYLMKFVEQNFSEKNQELLLEEFGDIRSEVRRIFSEHPKEFETCERIERFVETITNIIKQIVFLSANSFDVVVGRILVRGIDFDPKDQKIKLEVYQEALNRIDEFDAQINNYFANNN